jgi:hypothetical protein
MRAKPASRAITKFEFVINLTTALGLTVPMQTCLRSAEVPAGLVARADKVIE